MSVDVVRQIVLDTETTGLEVADGHRIIEIGCVELINRRPTGSTFWKYLNPQRDIDPGAIEVHGITNEFLADKPRFAEIAHSLFDYLRGAELVIHNAAFDMGFLHAEFARAGLAPRLAEVCQVTDTVALARKLFPGQKVNLDALCRRLSVDNRGRDLHGALLDARLLADVYLLMTGGQSALSLSGDEDEAAGAGQSAFDWYSVLGATPGPTLVVAASEQERGAHQSRLKAIAGKSGERFLWSSDLGEPASG